MAISVCFRSIQRQCEIAMHLSISYDRLISLWGSKRRRGETFICRLYVEAHVGFPYCVNYRWQQWATVWMVRRWIYGKSGPTIFWEYSTWMRYSDMALPRMCNWFGHTNHSLGAIGVKSVYVRRVVGTNIDDVYLMFEKKSSTLCCATRILS